MSFCRFCRCPGGSFVGPNRCQSKECDEKIGQPRTSAAGIIHGVPAGNAQAGGLQNLQKPPGLVTDDLLQVLRAGGRLVVSRIGAGVGLGVGPPASRSPGGLGLRVGNGRLPVGRVVEVLAGLRVGPGVGADQPADRVGRRREGVGPLLAGEVATVPVRPVERKGIGRGLSSSNRIPGPGAGDIQDQSPAPPAIVADSP
jgi:hypothetical protein